MVLASVDSKCANEKFIWFTYDVNRVAVMNALDSSRELMH